MQIFLALLYSGLVGGRVGNKKALTWDKFKDAHMTFQTRISDMQ